MLPRGGRHVPVPAGATFAPLGTTYRNRTRGSTQALSVTLVAETDPDVGRQAASGDSRRPPDPPPIRGDRQGQGPGACLLAPATPTDENGGLATVGTVADIVARPWLIAAGLARLAWRTYAGPHSSGVDRGRPASRGRGPVRQNRPGRSQPKAVPPNTPQPWRGESRDPSRRFAGLPSLARNRERRRGGWRRRRRAPAPAPRRRREGNGDAAATGWPAARRRGTPPHRRARSAARGRLTATGTGRRRPRWPQPVCSAARRRQADSRPLPRQPGSPDITSGALVAQAVAGRPVDDVVEDPP